MDLAKRSLQIRAPYGNPIPTQFLALIDCCKFQHRIAYKKYVVVSFLLIFQLIWKSSMRTLKKCSSHSSTYDFMISYENECINLEAYT